MVPTALQTLTTYDPRKARFLASFFDTFCGPEGTSVVVLRGLPGSGKSLVAQALADLANQGGWESSIWSADSFFMEEGSYVFRPENLNRNHGLCLKGYLKTLEEGTTSEARPLILVDNTNLSGVEAAPYMAAALAYGRQPILLTVHANSYEAFKRCVHGVPADKFKQMVEHAQEPALAPWWHLETFL